MGTVFHDLNRNGIYEPHFGEVPFTPRRDKDSLTINLIDCTEDDSYTCDIFPYSLDPMYSSLREFKLFPDESGKYSFDCSDCYGEYKLKLAQPVYFSDYYDDDMYDGMLFSVPPHDEAWRTSEFKYGNTREGSESGTIDPNLSGIIRNNFNANGETECFTMFGDLVSLVPKVQVIDWGIYFTDDENNESDDTTTGGAFFTSIPSVTFTVPPSQNPVNSPSQKPTKLVTSPLTHTMPPTAGPEVGSTNPLSELPPAQNPTIATTNDPTQNQTDLSMIMPLFFDIYNAIMSMIAKITSVFKY